MNPWTYFRILKGPMVGEVLTLIRGMPGVETVTDARDIRTAEGTYRRIKARLTRDPARFPDYVKDQSNGNVILDL